MKVVFLDVDGVLNGDYMWSLTKNRPNCQGYLGIGSSHVSHLAWILSQTKDENGEKPKVVLTSTWKYDYDEYLAEGYKNKIGKYLREHLKDWGVQIYETTTKYEYAHYRRGDGIRSYLRQHPEITSYVILDDEMFEDYNNELLEHIVHTDTIDGLTLEDSKKAIEILNNA